MSRNLNSCFININQAGNSSGGLVIAYSHAVDNIDGSCVWRLVSKYAHHHQVSIHKDCCIISAGSDGRVIMGFRGDTIPQEKGGRRSKTHRGTVSRLLEVAGLDVCNDGSVVIQVKTERVSGIPISRNLNNEGAKHRNMASANKVLQRATKTSIHGLSLCTSGNKDVLVSGSSCGLVDFSFL